MPSNHLILYHCLLLLPSIFPRIRVFSNELTLTIRWGKIAKYLSFSFTISLSNEHSGFIYFRTDRSSLFDLFAAQKTLKRVFSSTSLKASILRCSAFFMAQLSHLYMTTGKTIALTIRTFVSKVIPLLFNVLSRFVIAFLLGSKCLLFWWLQSPSAVILELQKIKSVTVSTFPICHEVTELDTMIFVFWMLSFKPVFTLSSFTFIKRLFSSSSLSAIKVVSSAYLWLLVFLLAILILACALPSLAFCVTYSA